MSIFAAVDMVETDRETMVLCWHDSRGLRRTLFFDATRRYIANEGVLMTKVVIGKLRDATARKIGAKHASVGSKRVRDEDGALHTLSTIDAGSKTIDRDLTYVFGRNVAKARRENKRVTGSADISPAKV